MEREKNLAILILIGGQSIRFGTDKAIIDLLGKPLITHQIDTLTKFDQDIYLVAHSMEQIFNYKKIIDFPEVIEFLVDDRQTFNLPKIFKPSLGVYSGFKELKNLGFKNAFLLSCDMPLIKPAAIDLMITESEGFEFTVPRWENGFLEPFFAIYPVEKTFKRAELVLKTQNFGILNVIDKSWNTNYISVEEKFRPIDEHLVSLMNINGPIDLVKIAEFYKN